MRIAIRADSSSQIGGGHVMRCLALAIAASDMGHEVIFICANVPGHLGAKIKSAGIETVWLTAQDTDEDPVVIENWRPIPIENDANQTQRALANFVPDWLILDQYALGGAWVKKLRAAFPDIKILAFDDLDREPLYADLLLNPAAFKGIHIRQPHMAMLRGPNYAMLRSEFSHARAEALKRRTGTIKKLVILPGFADSQRLAPVTLEALRAFPNIKAEVIMGSQSSSVQQVLQLIANQPNWSLTLDAEDMAKRILDADACIGAGGGSAWERCCLGLPSINIALAGNQMSNVQAMANAGAAIALGPSSLADPQTITDAFQELIENYESLSQNAAALCDGQGTNRIVAALSGTLRDVTLGDTKMIFEWRNQPHIRKASLHSGPLTWDKHVAYMHHVLNDSENHIWRVYQESGRDLGVANAKRLEDGSWTWGFYIGATSVPKGVGRRMMIPFLRQLNNKPGFIGVRAFVLADNYRSLALHKALGFRWVSDQSAFGGHNWLDTKTINARLGLGTQS